MYGVLSYLLGCSDGKKISKRNDIRIIGGTLAEIVKKNSDDMENTDNKNSRELISMLAKTKESLRIYEEVIEEFKKIK